MDTAKHNHDNEMLPGRDNRRNIIFLLLIAFALGILWFYHQVQVQIRHEQELVVQIHTNFLNQIMTELHNETKAFLAGAGRFMKDLEFLVDNPEFTVEALADHRIDGFMILDNQGNVIVERGVEISPGGFSRCLAGNDERHGIYYCPVTHHDIVYSVSRVPGKAFSLVFYKHLNQRLLEEISRITAHPLRLIGLDETPVEIPGFLYSLTTLANARGEPILKMVSYFRDSVRRASRNLLLVMLIFLLALALVAVFTRNLSREARLAAKLRSRNQELRRVMEERTALLHVLSHDLNNYVATVLGYSQLLAKREDLSQQTRNYLERILQSALKQRKIIAAVREQSALEDGKLHLRPQSTPLAPLLKQLREDFQLQLQKKRITLHLDPPPEETKVLVDAHTFSVNVLNNLLSNAIKFSHPDGEIRITTEIRDDKIRIFIEDRGIGIKREILKDLFTPGARTSRPGTAGEEGTGFGMAQVKRFLEAAGGTLQIESRSREEYPENSGTKIILTVPRG